jgi:hypothetical protein
MARGWVTVHADLFHSTFRWKRQTAISSSLSSTSFCSRSVHSVVRLLLEPPQSAVI